MRLLLRIDLGSTFFHLRAAGVLVVRLLLPAAWWWVGVVRTSTITIVIAAPRIAFVSFVPLSFVHENDEQHPPPLLLLYHAPLLR